MQWCHHLEATYGMDPWIWQSLVYKVQFAKHMKLKKNEDQSVDTLPLLRIGNNHPFLNSTENMWTFSIGKVA